MFSFKVLLRSLWRKKGFSLLNIAGLSVGIAASLLIFLLIRFELSVDTFHKNRDRIYRVVSTETDRAGNMELDGNAPLPVADAVRSEFPQPEEVAATWRIGSSLFAFTDPATGTEKKISTGGVYMVEPSLFRIFDYPWLAGDPQTALRDPYTLVLTRSVAASWFGRWQDAPGKTVLGGSDRKPYRVTGVMEDVPANTDLPMKVVLSYATFRTWRADEFTNPASYDNFSSASQCFFLLKRGATIASMNALLPGFVARHYTPLFEHSDTRDSAFFQPLKEMHFDKRLDRYGSNGWSYSELWSIGLIGLFLLAVACINFVNLATAQSLNRAREIGVRKVLGSNRRHLLGAFLGETAVLVFLALIAGCILAELALPALKHLLQKNISGHLLETPVVLLFLLAVWVAVTLLSGSYPGIVLAGFEPLAALKSKLGNVGKGGLSLRRSLIVLQFVIAQLLIIGTFVIVRQMSFFRSRAMGFDRSAIALVALPDGNVQKNGAFKSRVQQLPGVLSASLCSDAPVTDGFSMGLFFFDNRATAENFELIRRYADEQYLSTFRLSLIAGRYPHAADSNAREVVLNETAVKLLGFAVPGSIIGKTIDMDNGRKTIVGVLKDFNNATLREQIKPMILSPEATSFNTLAVKLDPAHIQRTMKGLQELHASLFPNALFYAPFMDDEIAGYYENEAVVSTLFKVFAALAIFISCLGLYGLVSFMIVRKTKEVGIRKVLGASVQHIVYLFSKEFIVLIGIAFLVAAPLGYYFMHQWLSDFYYHIDIGWDVFAFSIALSVLIACLTVGYKAFKAAMANPVVSLKTE